MKPKGRGSRRIFEHERLGIRVIIPDRGSGHVKPVYVEKLVHAVVKVREKA